MGHLFETYGKHCVVWLSKTTQQVDYPWMSIYHDCSSYFDLCHNMTDLEGEQLVFTIGITHVFSCVDICRAPRKLFKHKAVRPSVQTSSEGPGKC